MAEEQNTVERSIDIDAPAERVWRFIAEPGWYINDGAIVTHRIERNGGDLAFVHDDHHGRFAFRTETLDPPRYASFRWLDDPDAADSPSTLVEFTITPTSTGSVTLTVVESGFATLPGSALDRRRRLEDNIHGWVMELDLAKKWVEGSDAAVPVSG